MKNAALILAAAAGAAASPTFHGDAGGGAEFGAGFKGDVGAGFKGDVGAGIGGGFKGGVGLGGGFNFGKKFHNADRFTCPSNSKNKCDDKYRGGLKWGGLSPGGFKSFLGFDFKGWTCEDDSNLGKIISGEAGFDLDGALGFGCGADALTDIFTVKEFDVDVDIDARLEFHYMMPGGQTCKQSSDCSKGRNKIRNTQCGGAKDVKIIYPDGKKKGKGCKLKIPKIDFDCDDNTQPDIPDYTPPTPDTPDVPDTPDTPGTPDVPDTPDTPGTPDVPDTPGTPDVPDVPDTPNTEASELPEPTPTPGIPGTPGYTPPTGDKPSTVPEGGDTTTVAPSSPGETKTDTITNINTVTDCGPDVPNCGGKEKPVPTNTPEVPDVNCPDVVPKCINSWLHLVKECKSNMDAECFCPSKEFVDETYTCLYAHGESDDIISEAIQFFQGMCAPHVDKNPGIVTDVESITSCITVTGTPIVPDVPYTTIVVETTVTEPCVTDGTTKSTTTKTISTEITVPELPKQTPSKPQEPNQPEEPALTTGDSGKELPVPTGSEDELPEGPAPTEGSGGDVPSEGGDIPSDGGDVPSEGGDVPSEDDNNYAPPPAVTAPIPTVPGEQPATTPTPTPTPGVPTAGAGQVRAGLGLGLVVMAAVAAF